MFRPTLAQAVRHAVVAAGLLGSYACLQPTANAAPQSAKVKVAAASQSANATVAAPASAAVAIVATPAVATQTIATPIDFPTIVERYGPAVVNIRATAQQKQTSAAAPATIDANDPFTALFKFVSPQQDAQGSPPRAISGTGSGFIISPDGLILTTAHVVDQADEVTVRLTDRREFKGKVLVVDTESDVALVQIAATKLPTVKLGDSSRARPGEPVMTIGSPDSFQNTVTAGVISATSRMLPDGTSFSFLETDVAVNPDNSGGPLFNRAGEVIGIDVQIYANERYQSLTFAIPINVANKVRAQLQADSNPSGGRLGMEVQDVGGGLAVALGLPRAAGALVNSVTPGTPAAAGGLKAGDVIVQIGDKAIDRSAELSEYAAGMQPGSKTVLKLIRGRRPMTTRIMVTASGDNSGAGQNRDAGQDAGVAPDPDSGPIASAGPNPGSGPSPGAGPKAGAGLKAVSVQKASVALKANPVPKVKPDSEATVEPVADSVASAEPLAGAEPDEGSAADRLGLSMHSLSEEEKRASGLPVGLMVDVVSGPAAHAGIRPGDIVVSLDGELVESEEQAGELEAKAKKTVAVLIQRRNSRGFVSVDLR